MLAHGIYGFGWEYIDSPSSGVKTGGEHRGGLGRGSAGVNFEN